MVNICLTFAAISLDGMQEIPSQPASISKLGQAGW
jgi:hypothetical protein